MLWQVGDDYTPPMLKIIFALYCLIPLSVSAQVSLRINLKAVAEIETDQKVECWEKGNGILLAFTTKHFTNTHSFLSLSTHDLNPKKNYYLVDGDDLVGLETDKTYSLGQIPLGSAQSTIKIFVDKTSIKQCDNRLESFVMTLSPI